METRQKQILGRLKQIKYDTHFSAYKNEHNADLSTNKMGITK